MIIGKHDFSQAKIIVFICLFILSVETRYLSYFLNHKLQNFFYGLLIFNFEDPEHFSGDSLSSLDILGRVIIVGYFFCFTRYLASLHHLFLLTRFQQSSDYLCELTKTSPDTARLSTVRTTVLRSYLSFKLSPYPELQ